MYQYIFFDKELGYIRGNKMWDGFYWIDEFLLFPENRGKGKACELMKHMPKKARLFPYPLYEHKGPHIPYASLVRFCRKHGFEFTRDAKGNRIMERNQDG